MILLSILANLDIDVGTVRPPELRVADLLAMDGGTIAGRLHCNVLCSDCFDEIRKACNG